LARKFLPRNFWRENFWRENFPRHFFPHFSCSLPMSETWYLQRHWNSWKLLAFGTKITMRACRMRIFCRLKIRRKEVKLFEQISSSLCFVQRYVCF
jgi:hypothetical protein